jgi:hypothetical protein
MKLKFGQFVSLPAITHSYISYSAAIQKQVFVSITLSPVWTKHSGADKSLARPGRKQATATEDLVFIYPVYNHNLRNINTIYIYNETSIKRNILTIK